jgi:23S rRNA pseudouridine2605 synthase
LFQPIAYLYRMKQRSSGRRERTGRSNDRKRSDQKGDRRGKSAGFTKSRGGKPARGFTGRKRDSDADTGSKFEKDRGVRSRSTGDSRPAKFDSASGGEFKKSRPGADRFRKSDDTRSRGRKSEGDSKGEYRERSSGSSRFPKGDDTRSRSRRTDGDSKGEFRERSSGPSRFSKRDDTRSRGRKSEGDSKGEYRERSSGPSRFSKRDDTRSRGRKSEGDSKGEYRERSSGPSRFSKRDDTRSRGRKSEGDSKGEYRERSSGPSRFSKRDDNSSRGRRTDGDSKSEFRERSSGPSRFTKRDDSRSRGKKSEGDSNREFKGRNERGFSKSDDSNTGENSSERIGRGEFKERSSRPTRRSDKDAPGGKRYDADVKGEFKERSNRPRFKKNDNSREESSDTNENDATEYTNISRDESVKGELKERSNDRGERSDSKWNRKEKHEFYGDRKKSKSFASPSSEEGIRLNKYIANAGICSRREADELIGAGVISVNGEVITEMGYKVQPEDIVKYNNETLKSERLVYILLNKPKDFITTTDDPEDRKTVMSLIAKAGKERVYPVGRLDRNTTGVLLFTNDGDLAKKLTHPSFEVHKVYQVELDRAVKGTDMETIREGVRLDDGTIKADEIVYTNADKDVVGLELHSGKNRIVRRIFEQLGYEVKKLDRVVFAGLTKKDLPRGRWRFLTEMEIANLKMMTGR